MTGFRAERLNSIQPSQTILITSRARELRDQGRDVVGFGAGEPDFDTPEHIKEAAMRAMADGRTKYTRVGGTPALKQAIIKKFRRDNRLDYGADQVTASTGGKQVLYNALLAVLNPGDEVIIPSPCWVSYGDMVRLAQGEPRFVPGDLEADYLLSAEQLRAAITPRTRVFILNSPCNPTGFAYDKNRLRELCEVLLEHPEILILCDDIYEHILYDDRVFVNPAMLHPELKERTLIVNGVSKAYSMTGWRIGFGAGPREIIRDMETIQSQSTSNPSSISQAAAEAALTGPQDCVAYMRSVFQSRRDVAVRMLNAMPGVETASPHGAFYVFPDCSRVFAEAAFQDLKKGKSDTGTDSGFFCAHLLETFDTALVPGSAFGRDAGFRISYALGDHDLRRGLERVGNFISELYS